MNKSAKKYCWLLIIACFCVYTSTICMKMVYSSQVIEIIQKLGESKARVGLGLTAYYVTYAIAQLSLAPFVKKINMGKLMMYTVIASAVLYGIIPFTTQLYQLWIIMALNGIMHSSVWGGCMYYFGKYLPTDMNETACSIMSMGFIGGTIVSYVIAPVFIQHGIWQYTFLLFAALQFIATVYFVLVEKRVERYFEKNGPLEKAELPHVSQMQGGQKSNALPHLIVAVLASATLTALVTNTGYYVITNWFPTYLNNVFGLLSTHSVWVTIVLYVSSFICTNLGLAMCRRHKNVFSVFLFWLGVGATAFSLVHMLVYNKNLVLAIVLATVVISATRSVGTMLASYLPLIIKSHINAATTAMLLNAAASVGAAVGPLIAGALVDGSGWQPYFIFIFVASAAGFLATILCNHFIKKLTI